MTTDRAVMQQALERMDRAREILTNGNPRPECNWGMLDTSDLRAALAATTAAPRRELIDFAAWLLSPAPMRAIDELEENTHIGHRQFSRAQEATRETLRLKAIAISEFAKMPAAAPQAPIAQPLTDELDSLKKLITATHTAKGRYHSQMAMCNLYDAVGLKNVRPKQEGNK